MKPYSIEFVASNSVTEMVEMLDAFKFKPMGRAQWAQRLAWRFLLWRRAMTQAYEPKVITTRHLIDSDLFIDRLLKQKRALFDGYRLEGRRLIIGSEDYAELMTSPDVIPHHFNFRAEFGFNRQIVGLDVEVVPWMRGAVVMP
jgi:hypothetical protein